MDWLGDAYDTFQGALDTLTAVGFAVTFVVIAVLAVVTLIRR